MTQATEVITEPECRSGLREESTIFAEAGAGPGVGLLNENRTRSWSRSANFSFYRSRTIDFIISTFYERLIVRLIYSLYSLGQLGQSLVQAVEDEGGWQTGGLCSDLISA